MIGSAGGLARLLLAEVLDEEELDALGYSPKVVTAE
jgi:hypothetical protein